MYQLKYIIWLPILAVQEVKLNLVLIFSFFFKFYHYVNEKLNLEMIDEQKSINGDNNVTHTSKFAQYYKIIPNSQNPDDEVGRPIVHKSAIQQTTGIVLI